MPGNDHTRSEAIQCALNHAEAAEAADKAYRHGEDSLLGPTYIEKAMKDLAREAALATMWAQIAQAMPVD